MSAEGTRTAFDVAEFETAVTDADEARLIETIADGIGRLRDQIDDDTLDEVFRAQPGRYTMRSDFTRDRLDPEPLTQNRVIEPLLDALGYDDYGSEAGDFSAERGEQADYAIPLRDIEGVDSSRLLIEAEPTNKQLENRGHGLDQVESWLSQREFESDFDPRRARDFARADKRLAKTDQIDAKVLALFAERMRPEVGQSLPSETQQAFSALVARRRQLIEMRTAEQNRLQTAPSSEAVRQSVEAILSAIEKQLEEAERQLEAAIEQSPVWKEQAQLLESVPGVGKQTAHALIAQLPELGEANREEIAKLVGVAPINNDSGKRRGRRTIGRRTIWGGRADVRSTLYMAARVATRCNDRLQNFYHRLLEKGKAKKGALVAVMRKLLVILNTMVKNGTAWNPDLHASST